MKKKVHPADDSSLMNLEYSDLHPTIRDLSNAGVTAGDAKWIRQSGNARLVSEFIREKRGQAESKPLEHIIDCDADPHIPDGWKVEEHCKGGQFIWDPKNVRLHLDERQKKKIISGHNLRKCLENQHVLNANVLDYLFAHQELIPEDWKSKSVYFWGTVYRYRDRRPCVRYLYWRGDRWLRNYLWLGYDWFLRDLAAVAS